MQESVKEAPSALFLKFPQKIIHCLQKENLSEYWPLFRIVFTR